MSPENFDPQLIALESALATLAPAGGINRDQVLFRAGKAAATRRAWAWPCATAASMLLAVALGLLAALRPEPQPRLQIVYVPLPGQDSSEYQTVERSPVPADVANAAADGAGSSPAPFSYFRLQQLVQQWGIDAIPDSSTSSNNGPATTAMGAFDMRKNLNWPE